MQAPTATTILAGIWLPRIILPWWGKVFVCLVEAAGFAVAVYGCTKVYQVRCFPGLPLALACALLYECMSQVCMVALYPVAHFLPWRSAYKGQYSVLLV
jgi:hypothetical protein